MKNATKTLTLAILLALGCSQAYADQTAPCTYDPTTGKLTVGGADVTAKNATGVGYNAEVVAKVGGYSATYGTAIGNEATVNFENGTAIGYNAKVTLDMGTSTYGTNGTAIGANASVTNENSVALGSGSKATEKDTVSIGTTTSQRRLVNLAEGTADTDAVNKKQMDTELAKKADASDLATKADAATTLAGYGITDGATKTELEGKADKASTLAGYGITDGATKTELNAKADAATTLAGYGITDGATKTELADEAKAREDGDADTLKKANDYTDQEIAKISGGASTEALEKLDNKINQTNDRVDRVGATAAALAGIHYQPMAKGQSQVAVGMGGYKGKKATALGLAYQISDRVSGSVAGAANGSEHMFNVGFNYLFGQHSDKDVAKCAAVPGSMSLTEAELQAQVDSLNNKVAQLEAMVKALAAK